MVGWLRILGRGGWLEIRTRDGADLNRGRAWRYDEAGSASVHAMDAGHAIQAYRVILLAVYNVGKAGFQNNHGGRNATNYSTRSFWFGHVAAGTNDGCGWWGGTDSGSSRCFFRPRHIVTGIDGPRTSLTRI